MLILIFGHWEVGSLGGLGKIFAQNILYSKSEVGFAVGIWGLGSLGFFSTQPPTVEVEEK